MARYTGPKINEGSKGVWLGLGDPVRELPREFRRPLDTSIGDKQPTNIAAREVLCEQFDCHAGSDQEGSVLGETGEELVGQVDGR